jgi:hypothetical protein
MWNLPLTLNRFLTLKFASVFYSLSSPLTWLNSWPYSWHNGTSTIMAHLTPRTGFLLSRQNHTRVVLPLLPGPAFPSFDLHCDSLNLSIEGPRGQWLHLCELTKPGAPIPSPLISVVVVSPRCWERHLPPIWEFLGQCGWLTYWTCKINLGKWVKGWWVTVTY